MNDTKLNIEVYLEVQANAFRLFLISANNYKYKQKMANRNSFV